MLKLFTAKMTCAMASHIALEEAGADYEIATVDFGRNQQREPDYLAVNPKGRVPALVTDRGVLTETPAILVYIAQTHPDAGLAPLDDPFALAQLQAFNSYLCATVHVAHAHGRRGARWADDPAAWEAMKAKLPDNMTQCFRLIEDEMLQGPWVLGERYSVCDPYLHTVANWLKVDGVDIADFPKTADHFRRVAERPATQAALAAYG
ncbi:glutathione S-transferase family protein [Marinibaculum pumilum]|uniref:Glutathione S-transferase family protein n=1 Tax=Marinibaculum pumilum TaxID=1766165 RepID=A0ABV7L8Q9_9PROT